MKFVSYLLHNSTATFCVWIKALIDCEHSLFFFRFSEGSARAREKRRRQPEKKKEWLFFFVPVSRAFSQARGHLRVSRVLLDGPRKKRDCSLSKPLINDFSTKLTWDRSIFGFKNSDIDVFIDCSRYTGRECPVVLFSVPDGHTKPSPTAGNKAKVSHRERRGYVIHCSIACKPQASFSW